MKKIVLTGGGTAGHVTPHFALLPDLKKRDWDIHYIGTYEGIERGLIKDVLPYYPISAGKLRRYFDLKNFSDPFRVLKGAWQARRILKDLRPKVVFSKGGFVTVPVTVAAWSLGIPVILHESDLTPGLANRLSLPFAHRLCLTFPESLKYAKKKAVVTGTPIRSEITGGLQSEGLRLCNFSPKSPTLLIMGGSLGSAVLNEVIRANLLTLTKRYQLIHLCGRGNLIAGVTNARYCQFEYALKEMPHLLAAADFVISRAGANSIFELLALAKPNILVPLSKEVSRGDQILNAQSFVRHGFSLALWEEDLNLNTLLEKLTYLDENQSFFIQKMKASKMGDGTKNVLEIIEEYSK